jgi:chromosome segregation protein
MYLQKLEMVGFKSFAEKMTLEFLPPSATSKGITAVVGPNGSGKSNAADAIRWVLGEQSTKLLRGKKAEDVIFSGSEKRARAGYAEVTLFFNNESGRLPIDYSEVTISRRIYRDGDSEYLINKNKVRLTDIQLLLAEASFGARTYSVIGQGMVDNILVASPQERKEFFDEAAGVKQFQLKRHHSVMKMDNARENLQQAEMLVSEIEPRVRSLSRQVKRLEERDQLEQDLHALHHQYYGKLWTDLDRDLKEKGGQLATQEREWKAKESVLEEAKAELAKLEREETGDDGFSTLRNEYEKLISERSGVRERELRAKSKIEIAEQVQKQSFTPMPLSKIVSSLSELGGKHGAVAAKLRNAGTLDAAKKVADDVAALGAEAHDLRDKLEKPAPEKVEGKAAVDPAVLAELEIVKKDAATLEAKVEAVQAKMRSYSDDERKKKEKFFSLQRGIQDRISAAHAVERGLGDLRVELARLETRRDSLEAEMTTELGERKERIKEGFDPSTQVGPAESLHGQIQKLKYQLQLIGGIDPEVVHEYDETRKRYEYLDGQITDLRKAIDDLDRIIAELDITIKARSEAAFRQLNKDFNRYFQTLFDGGKAELVQIKDTDKPDEDEVEGEETVDAADKTKEEKSSGPRIERIVGIDIIATPPGKKIKNITMLSGGERAMTSIALICAIMTSNPSPFVVLDEVDAALDESNAERYATIIGELAEKTQFIVITHNRYTMRRANVLYGVTMRDDGTSQLLSMNLDEVGRFEEGGKAKASA